ncbi:caspase family protein [Piscinibacter sp. XHJ-5]|uniref:caspase family protein n=1 Tax=Piscinibacter sp. XHJ-5 TaxID=3037797 RepID=UPI0024531FA7|nr:caspase family protein [Piscinibacter sp. XHJ-5]
MASSTHGRSVPKHQAVSLHIGLNSVDPAHYGGWSGELSACEFDANDMAAIAKVQGMKATVLLTKKGTRAKVLSSIRAAAKALKSGDLFFLSYSGHGGQVPDVTGDEDDKQDETWCLYDAQLIDDELYHELGRFRAGVRIVVLSDSCHSGTVTRDLPATVAIVPTAQPSQRPKLMPRSVGLRTYRDNQAFYDRLQREVAKAAGDGVIDPDQALANVAVSSRLTGVVRNFKAAAVLISGCQDNQTSMDGAHNGAFTEQLLAVWNNGGFKGSYASFHARIRARLPPTQSPNLFALGAAGALMAQQPFSV